MKPIKEVYPDWKEDRYQGYDELLESLEYEILVKVDDEDWQGDSRLLLKDGDRYGILIFGWGSCSGCDALYGASSIEEVEELRNQLNDSIHWEPNKETLLAYMNYKDWELDFSFHQEETKQFIEEVKKLLGEPNAEPDKE